MSDKSRIVSTGLHDRADSPQSRSRGGNIINGEKSIEEAYSDLQDEYKVRTSPALIYIFILFLN